MSDRNVTATRLRDGDLVVADASEDEIGVGKSAEIRNLGTAEAVSGLHTFLLRAKDTRVQDGFRGFLLDNGPVREQLRRLATGLKVFGISKQSIRDVRVFLPPVPEQRAIADALSDVDGLLTELEALISKKARHQTSRQCSNSLPERLGCRGSVIAGRRRDLVKSVTSLGRV